MSYAVFFERIKTKKLYRLPVNPEEIKETQKLNYETYSVLKKGDISVPTTKALTEWEFEAEFPSTKYHYVETPKEFYRCATWESLFKIFMDKKEPLRFIATQDGNVNSGINSLVLIESLEKTETAGEEGDKIFSFSLVEYKEYGVLEVKKKEVVNELVSDSNSNNGKNPSSGKTYTVKKGDTLWAIAKRTYGRGTEYKKIAKANPKIKNPNLIYPGQVITLP